MTKSIRSKLAPLLGIALVATSLGVAAFPGTASADTAFASAQAAGGPSGPNGGTPLLNFPAEVRTGAPGSVSPDDDTPLPTPPALNVGVLGQDTFVDQYGHSVACAGLVASNASLNILSGANGCANANAGTGVELNLTGLITLRLDAVYAQCTAGSNQIPTADAFVLGNAQILVLGNVIATVPTTGLQEINPGSVVPPAVATLLSLAGIDINVLPIIRLTFEQTNAGVTKGSGSSATALHLELLGLINQDIGVVKCGPNATTGDEGSLSMDTSGDINVDQDPLTNYVQDGTRNAITYSYTPAGDRSGTRATFNIDTAKLEFDTSDTAAFAGCTPVNPTDSSTTCDFVPNGPGGILVGGTTATRTVPVKIKPGVTGTISTDPNVVALNDPTTVRATISNGAEPGADLVRRLAPVPLRSETSTYVVQAGGNAPQPGTPSGILLPTNIPGQLFVDMPYYVEYVEYDGEACTLRDNETPAFAIPATYDTNLIPAQRNLFDCGSSIGASDGLRITVAPDAPTNVDGTGRVVIRRTGPTNPLTPPAIPNNSYTSDIVIDVTAGPVIPVTDAPDIVLDKTVNSLPEPGGDFTYTLTVTNLDNEPATLTTLTDKITSGPKTGQVTNLNNVGTCHTGGVLAASNAGTTDTYTCTFTRSFTGITGDAESDLATAVARDNDGDNLTDTATDTALATIGNEHRLTVTKTAVNDELAAPGGVFTYEVTVTNADDQFDGDITLTSIIDEIAGQADVNLAGDADCNVNTVLSEGESCAFTFTDEFTGKAGDEQTDVVTVRGTAADGFPAVDSDEETVFIIDNTPGLIVTKTADPVSLPEPGGDFTYKVTVQNTLSKNVTLTTLTDTIDLVGNNDKTTNLDKVGTCAVGGVIKPGAANAYSCTFTTKFLGNAKDTQTDIVTAKADTAAPKVTYTDTDAETVTLTDVLPRIRVDESVDPAARKTPGGDFTWKVTVTNESKASSDPVEITSLRNELLLDLEKDPNCSKLLKVVLDVGESASCTFVTKVDGIDGRVGSDIVVVGAKDDEGNNVSDLGTAAVSLTAADAAVPTTPTTARTSMPKTGANSRTTAAAAMLFAGLGLVLTGGGMQQAPELALDDRRRRRRR